MSQATPSSFKRGQRVLYRRSVICGRAPEYGVIVRRDKTMPEWWIVRDEEPNPWNDGKRSQICEHSEMLSAA